MGDTAGKESHRTDRTVDHGGIGGEFGHFAERHRVADDLVVDDQQYEELVDNELHFSIKDAADGTTIRVMNGWWAATYYDHLPVATGDDFHFTVTRQMADDCSRFGGGKDLDLLVTQGQVTISKVYYEVEQ